MEVEDFFLPYKTCDSDGQNFKKNFLRISVGFGSLRSHDYLCEAKLESRSNRIVFGQQFQNVPVTVTFMSDNRSNSSALIRWKIIDSSLEIAQVFCEKDGRHEDTSHHRPNMRLDYLSFWSFTAQNFDFSLPSPNCEASDCFIDLPDSAARLKSINISWLSHDTACFEVRLPFSSYILIILRA